ncbi:MAG: hypothetical protein HeimC3_05610 [Candidatus Heimdallarchaeota archaeon LC_3]|nr:MAG: hypothetical protein HeimC3_05610 [Candidatus Heimdallarchaeota archaeon LC_3]
MLNYQIPKCFIGKLKRVSLVVNRINPLLYNKNWNLNLKTTIKNINDLIKDKKDNISYITKLIAVLDFLGHIKDIETIINLIKEKIEVNPFFKSSFEFIKLYSKKFYPTADERIKRIIEIRNLSYFDHKWYQEGFIKFIIDYQYETKKKLPNLEKINPDSISCTDPFWKFQIDFSRTWNSIFSGDYDKVHILFIELENIVNEYDLEICLPNLYKIKGVYYGSRGQLDESQIWFEKALTKGREINDINVLTTTENNLGIINQILGDFEKAQKFLLLSLQQPLSVKTEVSSLTNLAYNYYLKGSLEKSYEAYSQANDLLKNLPRDSSVKGSVKLGLGLIKATNGNTKDALPLFNEALENFAHHNDIEAQVGFHGTLVQLFYDTFEFNLAELHFDEFKKKIAHVKSYQSNFHIYAINVLLKLDQKKMDEARISLEKLKELSSNYSKNRLVRAWINFIQGVYERDLCNLNSAEQFLYKTIQETSQKGPYRLLLRNMVALSDVYHQKYILTNNPIYLDNMESILTQADEIGSKNPIFPTSLFVKLNFAMLAASKKDWSMVDELLEGVIQIVSEQAKFSLKNSVLTLVEQIKSQKYLLGDLSTGMTSLLFMGMGRQTKKVTFKENMLGIIMWKLTDLGAETIALHVPEEVIPKDLVDVALLLMGQLYVAVLGQGEFYHEGIFGPLPVPIPNTELRCLLSARTKIDTSAQDTRLKKKNYSLIGILYSKLSEIDVLTLNDILSDWWGQIDDLAEFSEEKFLSLKQLLLKKPLKLEFI